MYAFIVGNTNLIFSASGTKHQIDDTRLKGLEIEMREKIEKIKNFNPDSCYNFSEILEKDQTTNDSQNPDISAILPGGKFNSNIINAYYDKASNSTKSVKIKKLSEYKNYIKWLDLIASILIILGCILAQIENEDFYNDNLTERVEVVTLINDIKIKKGNITILGDLTKYNISYINNETYVKEINFTNFETIPVILNISEFCLLLRLMIALTTIMSLPLVVIGRYAEFMREYIYKENLQIKFHNSPMIYSLIFELLLILPFNYPGVNSYILKSELGDYICIPISSILASLTFLRFYFVLKLFNHLTKWTSTESEQICEKYVCKADSKFAFKAFQKENPFLILFVIFISTCVCFGLSLRNFEMLYWESRQGNSKFQEWNYAWNAMWCIFLSMTTVGYGDFYAKTHIGRFITIIACIIGTYFVSMMMVFMTQKSGLNENEKKAHNLISRLKLRNEIKDQQAFIVYNTLKMGKSRNLKSSGKISDKNFHIQNSYEKRNIITVIEIIKNKLKNIRTFETISLKEHLFDISERIDSDVKEIKKEIDALRFINEIIINFSDCQIEIAKYFKKNCYATKLLYTIISKKKIFGKLNNLDMKLKDIFETELDLKENEESDEDEYEDNIFNYDVNLDQIKNYFEFIFDNNKRKRKASTKASRTVEFIKRKKTGNDFKLTKIKEKIKKKFTLKNLKESIKEDK